MRRSPVDQRVEPTTVINSLGDRMCTILWPRDVGDDGPAAFADLVGHRGDWKVILPAIETEPVQLFHLAADPHEMHNLAGENEARVARLTRLTDRWYSGKPE